MLFTVTIHMVSKDRFLFEQSDPLEFRNWGLSMLHLLIQPAISDCGSFYVLAMCQRKAKPSKAKAVTTWGSLWEEKCRRHRQL